MYWWTSYPIPSVTASSATTQVSVRNTQVFRTALTPLTEPHTLWRRIRRYPSPRGRVAVHSISKMYFSHWSERMWSVNLDASISGVSDPRRAFLPAFRVTRSAGDKPGSADDKPGSTRERRRQTWECRRHVWEHLESQSCIQCEFSSMYLFIYIATNLQLRDSLRGCDRASLEMHLEVEIEWTESCTWRPWSI